MMLGWDLSKVHGHLITDLKGVLLTSSKIIKKVLHRFTARVPTWSHCTWILLLGLPLPLYILSTNIFPNPPKTGVLSSTVLGRLWLSYWGPGFLVLWKTRSGSGAGHHINRMEIWLSDQDTVCIVLLPSLPAPIHLFIGPSLPTLVIRDPHQLFPNPQHTHQHPDGWCDLITVDSIALSNWTQWALANRSQTFLR